MSLLISILLNTIILYLLYVFFWEEGTISLMCICEKNSFEAIKTYFLSWIIFWLINTLIAYLLRKIDKLSFLIFSFILFFITDTIILGFLTYFLNDILQITWIWYNVTWRISFVISVAILSVLNMINSFLSFKIKY